MASKESGSVAAVYAQALYDVAKGEGIVSRIEDELRAVDAMVSQDVSIRRFLETPTISLKDKEKVLRSALEGFHSVLLNFMLVGLEHRRLPGVLSGVIKAFHTLANDEQDIAELDIRTARKLDDAQIENIAGVMQKKLGRKVQLHETVDPKLLGGFVLAHGDVQWDASVQHRLKSLIGKMEETKFAGELAQ